MRSIGRFEMVELLIPVSTANRFNFADIPQLRSDVTKDIVVRAIEAFTADDIPTSFNGNPLVTLANFKLSSLTLYVDGEESTFRLPLVKLHNIFNAAAQEPAQFEINQFDNLQVDWTKSYISTPTAYGNVSPFSIMLGVTYQRLKPGTMARLKAAAGQNSCLPSGVNM